MNSCSVVHERVEAHARECPDRIAASAPDGQLSYGELDRRSAALAARLRARGAGPDVLVGLCVDRSLEMLIGLLGIVRSGSAYVPIDPAYPPQRIRLLIQESAVRLVVSVSRLHGLLDGSAEVEHVDAGPGVPPAEAMRRTDVSAANAAYLIFTSGSTGLPKGVVVTHGNMARLFEQTQPWFHFGPADVWTQFHSLSFDFSVWEIWGALVSGGRLVMVPGEMTRALDGFHEYVQAQQVTVLNQTPSAFAQFVASDQRRPCSSYALRLVIFGGEALNPRILASWVDRYGLDRPSLVNMYGITETTVHVTRQRVRPEHLARTSCPIGEAIPDLEIHLLDERGVPVPPGVPGRLHVTGTGLARGYLGRPALTAERFTAAPSGRGARMYDSGDLVMRTPEGDLVYLGRADDQLKVRGFRVEPREIETCLCAHPDVAAAAVVARDYGEGDVRLIAFLATRPDIETGRGEPGALAEALAARTARELPAHMRPSSYHVLAALPMTAQGKVDRAALRARPDDHPAARPDASTDERAVVRRIVVEVLRRSTIGDDDDLFDCGATSLALMRIIARINELFHVSLTGAELAGDASIAQLACCVESALADQPLARR